MPSLRDCLWSARVWKEENFSPATVSSMRDKRVKLSSSSPEREVSGVATCGRPIREWLSPVFLHLCDQVREDQEGSKIVGWLRVVKTAIKPGAGGRKRVQPHQVKSLNNMFH